MLTIHNICSVIDEDGSEGLKVISQFTDLQNNEIGEATFRNNIKDNDIFISVYLLTCKGENILKI